MDLITFSIVKGTERFIIRYEVGCEEQVLHAIIEWVHRTDLKFDWFDAAIFSHQIGQKLAAELKTFMPSI